MTDKRVVVLAPTHQHGREWRLDNHNNIPFPYRVQIFTPGDERERMRGLDFTGRRVVVLCPERADMQPLIQAARIQRADI